MDNITIPVLIAEKIKTALKTSLFRRLSWYTLASVVVQGSSFVSAVVVSRYLGPSNLGLYSFVQNYAGTVLTIIGGMDFYFVWKLAKSEDYFGDVQLYVGHKINIYITLALLGVSFVWIVLSHEVAFMITLLLVPACIQSLNIFGYLAMATNRARLVTMVQITVALTLLSSKIILVFLKAPLYAFVIVAALDLVLSGIITCTYFIQKPEWRNFFGSFRRPSFLNSYYFLYSIRLSIIALSCWQLLLRIDQLILATISTPYSLGIYSAAVKVAEIPNFLGGVLSTALVSHMAYISGREDADSKSKFKRTMLLFLMSGSVVSIVMIIFAPVAVHILYGSKFVESVEVLRVYALSISGMFMNYFFLGIYGVRDQHHHQVAIFGIAVMVNIVLVYILTPTFGLVGTAFSTVIAYSISALGFYYNLESKK